MSRRVLGERCYGAIEPSNQVTRRRRADPLQVAIAADVCMCPGRSRGHRSCFVAGLPTACRRDVPSPPPGNPVAGAEQRHGTSIRTAPRPPLLVAAAVPSPFQSPAVPSPAHGAFLSASCLGVSQVLPASLPPFAFSFGLSLSLLSLSPSLSFACSVLTLLSISLHRGGKALVAVPMKCER